MADYVKSKNIKIYPSAFRGSVNLDNKTYVYDPESRLSTEENNIRHYRLLGDFESLDANVLKSKGSFVITNITTYPKTSFSFDFVLNGYYFHIKDATQVFKKPASGINHYFAKIKLINKASTEASDTNNVDYDSKTLGDCESDSSNNLDRVLSNTSESSFVGLQIVNTLSTAIPDGVASDRDNWLELVTISADGKCSIPQAVRIKFSNNSIFGGLSRSGEQKSLADLLETTDIGFTNTIYSIGKTNNALDRNKNHIVLEGSKAKIKAAIFTNDANSGANKGNVVVSAEPSSSSYHTGESSGHNVFIDAANMIQAKAKNQISISSNDSDIRLNAYTGISLDASLGVSSTPESFRLPLLSDAEPDTFQNNTYHILATREWLNSDISLAGTKQFTDYFEITDSGKTKIFSVSGEEGSVSIHNGDLYIYDSNQNQSAYINSYGRIVSKEVTSPSLTVTRQGQRKWDNTAALMLDNGGLYVKQNAKIDGTLYLGQTTTTGTNPHTSISTDGFVTSLKTTLTNTTDVTVSELSGTYTYDSAFKVNGGAIIQKKLYVQSTDSATCTWVGGGTEGPLDLDDIPNDTKSYNGALVVQGEAWFRNGFKTGPNGSVRICSSAAPDPAHNAEGDPSALDVLGGASFGGQVYIRNEARIDVVNKQNPWAKGACALFTDGDIHSFAGVSAKRLRLLDNYTEDDSGHGRIYFGRTDTCFIAEGKLSRGSSGVLAFDNKSDNISIHTPNNIYMGCSKSNTSINALNNMTIAGSLTVTGKDYQLNEYGVTCADLGPRVRVAGYKNMHSFTIASKVVTTVDSQYKYESSIRYTKNTKLGNDEDQSNCWVVGLGAGTNSDNFGWWVNGLGDKSNASAAYLTPEGQMNAVSFNATSDARLKTNITPFKPKKSILDLPIYQYDLRSGLKDQIGCLAQDLREICPQIVEGEETEHSYLSIQESKITYLLLDELKKLSKKVSNLEKEIKKLKK